MGETRRTAGREGKGRAEKHGPAQRMVPCHRRSKFAVITKRNGGRGTFPASALGRQGCELPAKQNACVDNRPLDVLWGH